VSMYGDFVVPTTLASPSDYQTWTGVAGPANITQILRSVTTQVLDATLGSIYDVDPLTGLATNTLIKNALRDATCVQAAAWVKLGIDPNAGGVFLGGTKKSARLGAGSYELAGADAAARAKQAAVEGLVPDALRILQQRNLTGYGVYQVG
jgi:hypothetical protein